MRDAFFKWLGRVTSRRYWLVILISLITTALLGAAAANIRMETTWMSMLKPDSPSVTSFQQVLDEFGAATNIVLTLEGPSRERIIETAEAIVPELVDIEIESIDSDGVPVLMRAFRQVDYRLDTDFFKRHGFMLEKAKNLRKNLPLFSNYSLVPFFTHLNDVYEAQWVSDSDNLTKQEKDATRGLDGMFQLFDALTHHAQANTDGTASVQSGVDAFTIGDGYYLSSDKRMLLAFLTPTASINDINLSVITVDSLDKRLDLLMQDHPDVRAGLTGMHVVMRDEMRVGVDDTVRNLMVAGILILAIFILSFRMFTGPLLAMLVLITGITWDIGLTQLIIGRLNIITVMCSVVLVGLGIDYAIHIISSYTELRHRGESVERSVTLSFEKIGGGLLTGALTTAIAFFSLAVIGSPAFIEFGFVTGAGIVCCLLASLFLLPSVIVAKEKLWQLMTRREQPKRIDMEFRFLGRMADITTARPWITIALTLALTVFLALQIPNARMNRNYMDLEPEGIASVRLQREIVKRFHMSPDNMLAVYDDIETVNEIEDRLNSQPAVGMVESIATVLPSTARQVARLPFVNQIHDMQNHLPKAETIDGAALVEQLRRLSDNIIEISSMAYVGGLDRVFDKANQFVGLDEEGNQVDINRAEALADYIESHPESLKRLGDFQHEFIPAMRERVSTMSQPDTITLDMVPSSFRSRYVSDDGSHFLMAFYSRKDIWDGLFTSPFLATVTRYVPGATGTPVFMKELVETSKREGAIAFAIALLAIVILLLIDFRSLKTTLVSILPLLMSMVWLLGLMGLFDIRFTVINVIAFPLLIGMGVDDGVHVIHRYRVEGRLRLSYAISSIGKAILLTSITTMLGFGSLVSSEYRGYIGLGVLVTIGIGLCFVTSVIVLPAILKTIWGSRKDHPGFFKDSGAE